MNRHYRVIKKEQPSGETAYVIYQVHYDGQGTIQSVSTDPVSPFRETITDLQNDLEGMRQALDLPVLEAEDVLNLVEASGAVAYGNMIREQILETSDKADCPVASRVSHEDVAQTQQRKLEEIAATFAEKLRDDPAFGL
ncbi:MAG: hypothetical protein HXX11_20830 [Desulfuromonadales bacterium]|nr:hypothetical protein [Desulfuromonadales bacterium]